MIPLQVNEKYILSRTYGNIGQMFDKIEVEEGYTIVKEILDERLQALKNQSLLVEDLTEMDSYDTWIMAEKCSARTEAINQKKTERYQKLYQAKSRLLEAMGIEDVTAVLGNPDQDADTDEDWNMDEEEGDDTDLNDQERCVYYDITPSGNVLRKTFYSDFEHGDYQVLEWVKPDGTSKKLLESGYITLYKKGDDLTIEKIWHLSKCR